jgi:hypothetical protein
VAGPQRPRRSHHEAPRDPCGYGRAFDRFFRLAVIVITVTSPFGGIVSYI